MKRIVLLALGLVMAAGAQAQSFLQFQDNGSMFKLHVGYAGFDAKNLADKLGLDSSAIDLTNKNRPLARYPQGKDGLIGVGIEGMGCFSNILIGAELTGYFNQKATGSYIDTTGRKKPGTEGYSYTLSSQNYGVDATLNVGWVMVRTGGFLLYPIVGAGYSAFATRLQDSRSDRIYPFYVTNGGSFNKENAVISNSSLGLNFALGTEYVLGKNTSDRARGFAIGLRVGYRLQTPADNWKINNNEIKFTGGEKLSTYGNSGPYVRLSIGYTSIGRKN